MPKKTKKEKRAADTRHRIQPSSSFAVPSTPQTPTGFSYQFTATAKQQMQSASDAGELQAIRADVLKTLILAAIAISIELVLYWKLRL